MSKVKGTVRSDTGFYIGDICYVLSEAIYDGFWYEKKRYADGVFEVPDTQYSFAVGSTAYGDGTYFDNYGNEYPVDAGVIGLVPLELVGKDGLKNGTVIETTGTAKFEAEDGLFNITMPDGDVISIVTYDDYWESEYDDE